MSSPGERLQTDLTLVVRASYVKEYISNTSPVSCVSTEQGKAAVGLVHSQPQNRSGGLRAPGLPRGGTGARLDPERSEAWAGRAVSWAGAGPGQGGWGAAGAAVGPSAPLPWSHRSHRRSGEINLQKNNGISPPLYRFVARRLWQYGAVPCQGCVQRAGSELASPVAFSQSQIS